MKKLMIVGAMLAAVSSGIGSSAAGADRRETGSAIVFSAAPPVQVPCVHSWGRPEAGCFRIFIEARAREGREGGVAYQYSASAASNIAGTSAYTESGGACVATLKQDLLVPVKEWSNGPYTIPTNAVRVDANRPYRFFLTFACDQRIVIGEQVTISATFWVSSGRTDTNGEDVAQPVHLDASKIPIRPMAG